MARNLLKESEWAKNKYVIIQSKLDIQEYGSLVAEIKDELGINEFLRRALKLYEANRELFKTTKDD